jgi:hypothetical protein
MVVAYERLCIPQYICMLGLIISDSRIWHHWDMRAKLVKCLRRGAANWTTEFLYLHTNRTKSAVYLCNQTANLASGDRDSRWAWFTLKNGQALSIASHSLNRFLRATSERVPGSFKTRLPALQNASKFTLFQVSYYAIIQTLTADNYVFVWQNTRFFLYSESFIKKCFGVYALVHFKLSSVFSDLDLTFICSLTLNTE